MNGGDDLVVVGVVGKPVGLRGEVLVPPDADLDIDLAVGDRVDGDGRVLEIATARLHGGRQCVTFVGVADREAAEALRGTVLRVPRDRVPVDDGDLWVSDLLGLVVRTPEGQRLGTVADVRDGYAHDYLIVATADRGEVMVPFVDELVAVEDDGIVVTAPPGLFDDGAAATPDPRAG